MKRVVSCYKWGISFNAGIWKRFCIFTLHKFCPIIICVSESAVLCFFPLVNGNSIFALRQFYANQPFAICCVLCRFAYNGNLIAAQLCCLRNKFFSFCRKPCVCFRLFRRFFSRRTIFVFSSFRFFTILFGRRGYFFFSFGVFTFFAGLPTLLAFLRFGVLIVIFIVERVLAIICSSILLLCCKTFFQLFISVDKFVQFR